MSTAFLATQVAVEVPALVPRSATLGSQNKMQDNSRSGDSERALSPSRVLTTSRCMHSIRISLIPRLTGGVEGGSMPLEQDLMDVYSVFMGVDNLVRISMGTGYDGFV